MNARQTAAAALLAVEQEGSYSNLVLEPWFRRENLSPQDRAFCSALFYGVLERRITLDWVLDRYSRTPVRKLEPEIRAALRLGALQLTAFSSVPAAAAVSESVEVVRALGKGKAAGLVNGVLRAMLRGNCAAPPPKDKLTALSVAYSVPAPLIQLWRRSYGHDTALEILGGTRGPAPIFARVNTVKITTAALRERLASEGTASELIPGVKDALRLVDPGAVGESPAFREGLFHIQDISSQLCTAALEARPGMEVLDLCAAPGGKTFTLAQGWGTGGGCWRGSSIPSAWSWWRRGPPAWGFPRWRPSRGTPWFWTLVWWNGSTGCFATSPAPAWGRCGGNRKSGINRWIHWTDCRICSIIYFGMLHTI